MKWGKKISPTSPTGSHPVIEFRQIPITHGPLSRLEEVRPRLLNEVVNRTLNEFSNRNLEVLLGEALYSERVRIKRNRGNLFTKSRDKNDKRIWNHVLATLVRPPAEIDRKLILEKVVRHYAEEIGGHFDPRVYRFATHAVPWGFSWLLNAASVQRFLPWGMTKSLESCIRILGEVPTLQKLAKKGTILLVPTHQSNIDSVLIGYIIYLMSLPPFAYGAGLNLFKNPVLSFFMSHLGSYTVDRQKANQIYKETLKNYSVQILKEGMHSIFFPGGGRTRSGAIESKLKLGLLGTGLQAQLEGLRSGKKDTRVYIVPMVTSYHFVLEASSLIEDYLTEAGKHRYILSNDESWQPAKILGFFWKFFSAQTGVTVRIGKPLDVFGNFVDEEGQSIGPNGSVIDHVRWLSTCGELRSEPQRDKEYTNELGLRLVDRFHRENTVLNSHLVAFTFFETLRKKYPEFDLYRLLRLTFAQRSMQLSEFFISAETYYNRLLEFANRGELFLCTELRSAKTEDWVEEGVRQLGFIHDSAVLKIQKGRVWTEDMNLLYYYRNRLAGYGLSLLADSDTNRMISRQYDSKGFLA